MAVDLQLEHCNILLFPYIYATHKHKWYFLLHWHHVVGFTIIHFFLHWHHVVLFKWRTFYFRVYCRWWWFVQVILKYVYSISFYEKSLNLCFWHSFSQ